MYKALLFVLVAVNTVRSCTDLIVTKGATQSGCHMFTYNADSSTLFGELYHYPANTYQSGDMRQITDWDTGAEIGYIPEVNETYNVIGNMNEWGLAIGESTWEGQEELVDGTKLTGWNNTLIDYGSLIYISLQRCKTAREAIQNMINLSNTYGYYSEGESFTISDANELWILDLIGRGPYADYSTSESNKTCWVARRIPDKSVSGHANQCRMTVIEDYFGEQDEDNFIWDTTMADFAFERGYITEKPDNTTTYSFDYVNAFNPYSLMGARMCDGRVFTIFQRLNATYTNSTGTYSYSDFQDYVNGTNPGNRPPLFFDVPDDTIVTVHDMEDAISNHFENNQDLDMTLATDPGAGPWQWGNRHHPLFWYAENNYSSSTEPVQHFHERPIATQQTGWSFIAVVRPCPQNTSVDDITEYEFPIAGLFYFGVDDAATALHVPFYPGMQRLPWNWESKVNTSGHDHPYFSVNTFSYDSMFWVQTMISNFAYTDFKHIYTAVHKKRADLNDFFDGAVNVTDEEIRRIFREESNQTLARQQAHEYVTDVCQEWAAMAHDELLALFDSLFLEYSDLVQRVPIESERDPTVTSLTYPDSWYKFIVKYTGDHYSTDQQEDSTTSSARSNSHTYTNSRSHHRNDYVHPAER